MDNMNINKLLPPFTTLNVDHYKRAVSIYKVSNIIDSKNSLYISIYKWIEDKFKDLNIYTKKYEDGYRKDNKLYGRSKTDLIFETFTCKDDRFKILEINNEINKEFIKDFYLNLDEFNYYAIQRNRYAMVEMICNYIGKKYNLKAYSSGSLFMTFQYSEEFCDDLIPL